MKKTVNSATNVPAVITLCTDQQLHYLRKQLSMTEMTEFVLCQRFHVHALEFLPANQFNAAVNAICAASAQNIARPIIQHDPMANERMRLMAANRRQKNHETALKYLACFIVVVIFACVVVSFSTSHAKLPRHAVKAPAQTEIAQQQQHTSASRTPIKPEPALLPGIFEDDAADPYEDEDEGKSMEDVFQKFYKK